MVKIASYWQPGSDPVVRVYSNAEEVELLLDGETLGRRKPERDKIGQRLAHPPFRFDLGRFRPGTLVARAYINGSQVAEDRVVTPGAATNLSVELATRGVPVEENDIVFARATLIDAAGHPVPQSGTPIDFDAEGGWEIVGASQAETEAGTASVLVRSTSPRATGSIVASALGLPPATFNQH